MKMVRKNILCIIILMSMSILVLGCGGVYRSSQVSHATLEEREHVIYKNITLKASVAVINHESIWTGKLMKVRARLKNMLSRQVNAEVKIKFLDSSGYEIIDNWGWQPLIMESGEITTLERIAPSPQANDYRIVIQLAGIGDE